MSEIKEKLFQQFPPITNEEWRAKVEVDLKGADFNKKLVWRTNEGFNVQPMYRGDDIKDLKAIDSLPGEYPFIRGTRTNNDWAIRQNIDEDNLKDANAKAKAIITKGVTDLGFTVDSDVDFDILFDGLNISKTQIDLICCPKCALTIAKKLVDYLVKNNAADTFIGSIKFDPFIHQLKHGEAFPQEIKALACDLLKAAKPVKGLRVLSVDSILLNNAGAFIYQELGYALSWGNEWIAELTDAGFSAEEVANRIKFNMGISTVYFMEIAKFRAARLLWAQIVKQYNPDSDCSCKMVVNARTTEFNQTIYDSYVNLLRSQTESMSAALAGVDSITVTPFDHPYKEPDEFSERLARNQQILLKEESHLDKVVDPAGGSYYIETLTEDKGGFKAALESGSITEAVNASAQTRFGKVAQRREQLVGTNQFPNFTEKAGDKAPVKKECKCECGESALNNKRLASGFEEIRFATEKASNTPKVFMLTIGNLAMRLARAQFSANFFACAGYEIIDNNGFSTIQEGIDAAINKKADIVVLCSSDDEYAQYAPEAFSILNGRAEFVVAGPVNEDFQKIGINNFVNVRSNVLETLKAFNAKLLK
jgi:methylmalonyl-CoA mutase